VSEPVPAAGITADPELIPSGAGIRRWVRRASVRHATARPMELFGDVYTAVFGFAMGTAMIVALSRSAGQSAGHGRRGAGTSTSAVSAAKVLEPGWVAVLLVAAALFAAAGLAARLGPISVSAPAAKWLLALPVDRRSLLRPAAMRWPALATVLGAPCGVAVFLALGGGTSGRQILPATVLGAALAGSVILVVTAVQPHARARRAARATGDTLLAAVPALGLVLGLTGAAPLTPTGALGPAAVVAAVAFAGLALLADRRGAHVPDAALRAGGSVSDEARGAAMSLDGRALARALGEQSEPTERRRSSALGWLGAAPVQLRPQLALVTADALLLLRTPRHLGQLVAAACLPVLALTLPGPPRWLVVVVVLGSALLAGSAAAEGSRRAQFNPALDAALPLGDEQVRRARLVVPVIAVAAWTIPVFGAVAWRYPGGGSWLLLGVAAAPAWGAAAVRGAYRALPNYAAPLVATPMGALPTGAIGVALKGPDVAVALAVPALAAQAGRGLSPLLIVVQALLGVVALNVVARPPRRPTDPAAPVAGPPGGGAVATLRHRGRLGGTEGS